MKYNRPVSIFIIFSCVTIIFCLANCTTSKTDSVPYLKANLKIISTAFISREIFKINDAVVAGNRIYAIDGKNNIWQIDLNDNSEKIIITHGVGKNEIYKAQKLTIKDDYCWVNSYADFDKIFRFNIATENQDVELFRFPTGIVNIDSLVPLPEDKVICVFSGWEDSLLKIIDLNKATVEASAGKRTYIKAMKRFNINVPDIKSFDGKIYVSQSIEPVIQVFSIQPLTKIDTIDLSPPFYAPLPGAYDVPKNDHKAHLAWMASWDRIDSIAIDKEWMLIKYVRGYKVNFYYELLNLYDSGQRFYIDATSEYIVDFRVINGSFFVITLEENEQETRWKKGEIIL